MDDGGRERPAQTGPLPCDERVWCVAADVLRSLVVTMALIGLGVVLTYALVLEVLAALFMC